MRISDWSSGVCSSDLLDGFRVEGSPDTLDFRLMRFERNDIRVPPRGADDGCREEALLPTSALRVSPGPFAWAELHKTAERRVRKEWFSTLRSRSAPDE